jgi:hypothetical protein
VQQYDGPGAAVEPPGPSETADPAEAATPSEPSAAPPPKARHRHARRRTPWFLLVLVVAGLLGVGLAVVITRVLLPDDTAPVAVPRPTATSSPNAGDNRTSSASPSQQPSPTDTTQARNQAVAKLLAARAAAVLAKDRDGFLDTVDTTDSTFYAGQVQLVDRLDALDFASWSYTIVGDGPGLPAARAAALPAGSTILRVRLSYQLAGTETTVDREQYLTVVPRRDGWLVSSDSDGAAEGYDTDRDLWDLGPVRELRGDSSVVVADTQGLTTPQLRRIADEADLAVRDVDDVWTGEWSRRPLVVVPRTQQDMATLIDSDGDGLAQIAAVTTGSFESGMSRGDRIVINPAAWVTLGQVGRRVVLTHEMTHVATRATSVQAPPIWLSEGFADYVAYQATPVPTTIVASDILDDVRDGNMPKHLPNDADFDASRGDIAAAYESAWLACRMVAERYGEKKLVTLYSSLVDSSGPGWPQESVDVLGIGQKQITQDWKAYLRQKAAA